jgi:uncharacterized protein (DUF169 family)
MRTDYSAIDQALVSTLGPVRPIAVAYLEQAPAGDGFYTTPSDHLNCPIGAYTHAIDLPPARLPELDQTLSLMASIGYVRMEEVPSIPRLPSQPAILYYARLGRTLVDPDVVIVAGRPGSLMRLQEAAARAGAASQLPLLGRPTCMALPAAMAHGSVMSAGCIGNRVYTGLGDDELYLMIPGARLADIASQLAVIASANETLEGHHKARRASLLT